MINRYLKIVAVLLLMTYTAFANAEIGIYDLRYTLNTDLNTKEGLDVAWDDVHAVSIARSGKQGCSPVVCLLCNGG